MKHGVRMQRLEPVLRQLERPLLVPGWEDICAARAITAKRGGATSMRTAIDGCRVYATGHSSYRGAWDPPGMGSEGVDWQ